MHIEVETEINILFSQCIYSKSADQVCSSLYTVLDRVYVL